MEQDQTQKRWTAKRRASLVLEILRGDRSVAEAARKHGLTVAEIEEWRDRGTARASPRRSRASGVDEEGV